MTYSKLLLDSLVAAFPLPPDLVNLAAEVRGETLLSASTEKVAHVVQLLLSRRRGHEERIASSDDCCQL